MTTNPNPARRKNIKPGLQVPSGLPVELEKFLQGVKESLQGGDGTRGQPLERFVTLAELKTAGLINTGVKNGRGVITEVIHPESGNSASSASSNLGDLGDVLVTTPVADGGVLLFDSALGQWESGALVDSSEIEWTYDPNVPSLSAALIDASVTFARLQDFDALSVLGRSANSQAVGDEIVAGANDRLLARVADAVAFTQLTAGMFPAALTLTTNFTLTGTFELYNAAPHKISDATGLPALAMNGTSALLANLGGAGSGAAFMLLQRYNAAAGGPDIGMYHSRGATVDTHTILASGDEIGSLSFYASDGTSTPVKVARIIGVINGAVGGAGDLPSRIDIRATPDGSATNQAVASFSPAEIQLDATTFDFNGTLDVTGSGHSITGALTLVSAVTFSTSFDINAANSFYYMTETGVTAENGAWLFQANNEALIFHLSNDAKNAFTTWLQVERTANTVDSLQLIATTFNFDGNIDFDGTTYDIDAATTLSLHGGSVDLVAAGTTLAVTATTTTISGELRVGIAGGTSSPFRMIANDTIGDCYVGIFEDDTTTRKAYFGFGNTTNNVMHFVNEEGTDTPDLGLSAGTDGAVRLYNDALGHQLAFFVDAEVELNATLFDFNGTLDVDGLAHDISGTSITISGTGETLATFVDDGACTFYHNNVSRIATSATGVDMVAGTFRLFGYTVATLPAGTVGQTAYVTDALAPAFLTALVGGGAIVTPAFYDGTNWVAI